ncbi:MAG: GtrA family protein [Thiobacillaceae bacterium]
MKWHIQFSRYAVVGLVSNGVGYLLYLLATWLGAGPKTAMTGLYILGVLQTFVFNKKWSFRFAGAAAPALVRYAMVYMLGYVINFMALMLLVDQAGLPHQWVMAGLVLCMAMFFFVGQKFWVFRHTPNAEPRG